MLVLASQRFLINVCSMLIQGLGLGHVRLSIIDLSPEGNQPFHDSDDNIHAVVNGELYDHDRLRAELAADYNFKGQSDCEILLALYKKYSLSLVDHLRGEFAFVLWDAKREILFAGRDRYGIKSLYYTIDDGRLLIATEIKSLLAFGWQPEWDVRSIVEQGYLQDRRTLFKNVFKVRLAFLHRFHFGKAVEQKLNENR